MNKRWESFQGRQYSATARKEPRVTLGRRGIIYLNEPAFDALGRPGAVEMLFDGNERVIGLKPIDARRSNAFLIKDHTASKYKKICAASFLRHYRIKTDTTLLFEAIDMDDDGVLMLDMHRTIRIGRGAR